MEKNGVRETIKKPDRVMTPSGSYLLTPHPISSETWLDACVIFRSTQVWLIPLISSDFAVQAPMKSVFIGGATRGSAD